MEGKKNNISIEMIVSGKSSRHHCYNACLLDRCKHRLWGCLGVRFKNGYMILHKQNY